MSSFWSAGDDYWAEREQIHVRYATLGPSACSGTQPTESADRTEQLGAAPADGVADVFALIISNIASYAMEPMVEFYDILTVNHGVAPESITFLVAGSSIPAGYGDRVDGLAQTKDDFINALSALAAQADLDDLLIVNVEAHGRGYLLYGPEHAKNDAFHGYCDVQPQVNQDGDADQFDFRESTYEFSAFCGAGMNVGDLHAGLDEWLTNWYPNSTCVRWMYRSHYTGVQVEGLGSLSDNDEDIDRFTDYTLGDLNHDGYITPATGETWDFDGDGVPPYDRYTGVFDEDDWGGLDAFQDDHRSTHSPLIGIPYRIFDAELDNRLDIDVYPSGAGTLEIDGTDLDNDGSIEGVDLNDDGDMTDWVAVDETLCLWKEELTDDEVAEAFNPIEVGAKIFITNTCHGGGFVADLSGPRTIVMTGSLEATLAPSGLFPGLLNQGLYLYADEADIDRNGRISPVEAFQSAELHTHTGVAEGMDLFQYDDNGDGVPHDYPLPKAGDGDFGAGVFFPGALPSWRIVDDGGSTGFAASGFTTSTTEGYQGDFRYRAAGSGESYAQWTFTVEPGQYRVAATWPAGPDRASNSPFSVYDDWVLRETVPVNQQAAPDDFAGQGANWETLGTFEIRTGTLVAKLTDSANGMVAADAIRIERLGAVGGPEIGMLVGQRPLRDSAWGLVDEMKGAAGRPGPTQTFTVRNHGSTALTLGSISLPTGFLLAEGLAASLAPGEYDTFTIQLQTTSVGTFTGWLSIPTNDTDEWSFDIQLIGGVAAAPSVPLALDDGAPEFTLSGEWGHDPSQAYQSDIHVSSPGTGADVADWTFSYLTPGTYQVAANWFASGNRASNAPYTVLDGTTALATVRVNQQAVPNDFTYDGAAWETLGTFTVSGDTLVVKLNDDADGLVVADGIYIARFGNPDTLPPTVQSVTVNDTLLSDTDAGVAKFTVTVQFSETMDTIAAPALAFNPDVAGGATPTLINPSMAWFQTNVANDTYRVTYDVMDRNVTNDDVTIDVTAACDVSGNKQQDYTPEEEFDLDTENPVVTLAAPALINDTTPSVTVNAADASGLPNGAAVTMDVDLNNDGDFADANERGYTSSTLTGGSATFDLSPALAQGTYTLRARVSDQASNEGVSATRFLVVDTSAPMADIVDVAPDPRSTAVGIVTVNFSENVSGVDIADFTLIRDGASVNISALVVAGSGSSYTIDLSSVTAAPGAYVFALVATGSGIQDAVGNALAADASDSWATDNTTALAVTGITPELSGTLAPLSILDVTFSGPIDPVHFRGEDVALLQLDNVNVSRLGAFGGTFNDVVVEGPLLYAATYTGLQIFDVSNPTTVTRLGGYDAGQAHGVEVVGSLAYVASAWGGGLDILDVSNPAAVARMGSYSMGDAYGVDVVGNLAYVAAGASGVRVLDVSNPAAIRLLGTYDSPGSAVRVHIAGSRAYVADGYSGLQILDVANPGAVALLGGYDTPGAVRDVAVAGSVAYVTDTSTGLHILDVSNPAAATLLGVFDTPGNADGVHVLDSTAYVADGYAGLQILNVSNPAAVTRLGGYDTSGNVYNVQVIGSIGYVADGWSGLQVLDVADPAAVNWLGGYDTLGYPLDVQVIGSIVYAADHQGGLEILDVSDSAATTRLGLYDTPGTAYGVQVIGSVAYLADDSAGLQILDVSNPGAVTRLGGYNTAGFARAVQVVGSLAYVADHYAGLQILDVSNPAAVIRLGGYDTLGNALSLQVVGSLAYVADETAGLQILDVSNPAAVTRLGGYNTLGYASDVQVIGSVAYVADGTAGFQILDASNPAAVTRLGGYHTSGYADDVQVIGSVAYVADGTAGLQILDVSNPAAVSRLRRYTTSSSASGVYVVGSRAYVADSYGGLQILQVGSPATDVFYVSANTYRANLGRTLCEGEYALLLGPEILDCAGTAMDQDQDGTPREPSEDVYFARFRVGAATVAAPVIAGIADDTGSSASDGVTSDATLVISGTAEANATVEVFRGTSSAGTTVAGPSGAWIFDYTATALPEGTYQFTATARNAVDNVSPLSAVYNVVIETTAPTADVVDVTPDPRSAHAGTVTINFSESVTGVNIADFTLTRDGVGVDISGLAVTGSGTSYMLDLSSVTALPGSYVLTLVAAGSGIQDAAGNALGADANDAWTTSSSNSTVVGRHIFYNNSYFDNNPAAGRNDDNAIAPDKQSLLPGQTAGFAHYTSYSRGINGIMIDFDDLPGTLTTADFQFKVGITTTPDTWTAGPQPTVAIRHDVGAALVDRVVLVWPDAPNPGSISKQWLQVTVLANERTGLSSPDVFYFGNAMGDTGLGNTATRAYVDGTDFAGARDNPHNFVNRALVDDAFDFNRDSFVDGTDLAIVRDNNTNLVTALRLFTVPFVSGARGVLATRPASSVSSSGTLLGGSGATALNSTALEMGTSSTRAETGKTSSDFSGLTSRSDTVQQLVRDALLTELRFLPQFAPERKPWSDGVNSRLKAGDDMLSQLAEAVVKSVSARRKEDSSKPA